MTEAPIAARVEEGWAEVADGVFQRRYEPLDVSVGAIVGDTGITLIDTRNNPAEAAEIIRDVAADFGMPITAVVNTHAHYDHTFGNQAFAARGIPIYGHHRIPQHFDEHERPRLRRVQQDPQFEPDKAWAEVALTPPTVLVDAPLLIAPGGRAIELLPLGIGHTDTDLAVLVPDARAWFLGDVIEESGPPMFGSGSYPLDWPDALDSLLTGILPADVIVPGHGAPVDRDVIMRQAALLRTLADEIRALHHSGAAPDDLPRDRAVREFWPESFQRSAVRAGFAQLADA